MYRLIEIDGNVAGFEYHEDGTLTEEQARNMVKYAIYHSYQRNLFFLVQ
jgi:hypothetical protein